MPVSARDSILVTGGSGFIGSRVVSALATRAAVTATFWRNRHVRVSAAEWVRCDLTDSGATRKLLKAVKPRTIIHVAGSKDLLQCERSPSFAYASHVRTTENLLHASDDGTHFVYISSDCVFDGTRERFAEDDERRAANVYGEMKSTCEDLVASFARPATIVRVSLAYGWQLPGQTSNTVMDVLRAAVRGWPLAFPSNLFNTAIFVDDAAAIIAATAVTRPNGILHAAGPDRLCRLDLARATARTFGIPEKSIAATTVHSRIRPVNSCLSFEATAQRLNVAPRDLASGLTAMKDELADAALAVAVRAQLAEEQPRAL
jgi:dTDP-4-dehydrorhamnose reductase